MTLTGVKLERFTAFEDLEVKFSPGINALVGANGTGKTHLMKVCYAACGVSKTGDDFRGKLLQVFLPSGRRSTRLPKQSQQETQGTVKVHSGERSLSATFSNTEILLGTVKIGDVDPWAGSPIASVYIPPKEMLANAPGFLSLYAAREVHFEEIYRDLLHGAYLPGLREPVDDAHRRMLESLENVIGGKVIVKGEEFS